MVTHPLPTPKQPGTMAPAARQIESIRARGVDVEVLELSGISKLKYLQALPRLRRQLLHVDIVHAHFGYCGWLARLQRRKPVVVSFMGDDLLGTPDSNGRVRMLSRVPVRINRWLARYVDAVIVKSVAMAKVVAPVRAHVVPNGVDVQLFRPLPQAQARRELGWDDQRRYVLFAGNPDNPRKGYRLAEATMALLRQQTEQEPKLVTLWGVAGDRVPLYMNGCDALLMTSFIEGSPNVVKEAMACNLPVVAVPVGDVGELLDGVAASAICPYDAALLAAALARVLAAGQRSDGAAALQDKGLALPQVARRICEIYTEVERANMERKSR